MKFRDNAKTTRKSWLLKEAELLSMWFYPYTYYKKNYKKLLRSPARFLHFSRFAKIKFRDNAKTIRKSWLLKEAKLFRIDFCTLPRGKKCIFSRIEAVSNYMGFSRNRFLHFTRKLRENHDYSKKQSCSACDFTHIPIIKKITKNYWGLQVVFCV